MKSKWILALVTLVEMSRGAAAHAGNLKALEETDMNVLAARAAKRIARCPGLKGLTAPAISDVSNRTDEHLDKSVLRAAVGAALAKKFPPSDGSLSLELVLTSEKTEKPGAWYRAVYTLESHVKSASGELCLSKAALEKSSQRP